jgi:cytochrome c-type biogenesis protein CcmH/NrfG
LGRCLRGAAGLAAALALLVVGCTRREDFYLGELKRTEARAGAEADQRRIAELESGIRKYRQEVDRKVRASDQLGVYYRMLAVRYMELGMYRQAYEALEEARKIYPENPVLNYYAGVCAARLSLGQVEDEERRQWLERAERYYRRAIELDPLHSESMYALAVLLAYELKRPEEAEALLLRLLEREKKNADALFLLGGLYFGSGRLEQALEAYRRLEGLNLSEDRRRQAGENRKKIEDEMHGSR